MFMQDRMVMNGSNTTQMQYKKKRTTQHTTAQHTKTQHTKTQRSTIISNVTTFLQDRLTNELFKLKSNVMYSDMHAKVAQFNHDMWKQKNQFS